MKKRDTPGWANPEEYESLDPAKRRNGVRRRIAGASVIAKPGLEGKS